VVNNTGSYTWPSNSETIADVQGWLDAPGTNFGWVLHNDEVGAPPTTKRFVSRNSSNTANRPALLVTYTLASSATAVPSGNGCVVGSGGIAEPDFRLLSNIPPRLGYSTFQLRTINGLPLGNTSFYLAASIAAVPTPLPGTNGCAVFLDLVSAQTFINMGLSPIGPVPSPMGSFVLPIPLPNDPGLLNVSISVQAASFDGISFLASNALTLTFAN
jgi:hypothetical protein